jgi:hypothetical protein
MRVILSGILTVVLFAGAAAPLAAEDAAAAKAGPVYNLTLEGMT